MDVMRTFGSLGLDRDGFWEVSRLEPHVAIRFKQMFPRVPKNSTGPFTLPKTPMMASDLSWFLSRYPLAQTEHVTIELSRDVAQFTQTQAELEQIFLPTYRTKKIAGLKPDQKIRRYQSQATDLLRTRASLLLGDEGGLGKTYTAAAFLCAEAQSLPAAVICDTHLQKQWRDKIEAFTTLRVHVIKTKKPYSLPEADVYVFRVSQIGGWIDLLNTGFFKAAIFDEPQSLRTGVSTEKGAACKQLALHALYRLGLTGTPIYGYGREIWNVMQFIDDAVLGSYEDFAREWLDQNDRIKDPKALGTYLREANVFLRRTKGDVGQELPRVQPIVENVDYDAKAIESVESLARALAIKASSGSFVERGQATRDLDLLMRQATGLSKARAVAQFARMVVETGQKVLLVGWHRAVYDIWLQQIADLKPVMYTGSESAAAKNRSKEAFVSGDSNVMILSLRSGAGLDGLQHVCSTVIFGELDWAPGIHQQVIWRLDREGQTQPVNAFFLVSDDGSDPIIMDVLGIKASESTQVVDPHLGVQINDIDTSNLQKLVERYLKKDAPAAANDDLAQAA